MLHSDLVKLICTDPKAQHKKSSLTCSCSVAFIRACAENESRPSNIKITQDQLPNFALDHKSMKNELMNTTRDYKRKKTAACIKMRHSRVAHKK